jgi:hypothetical protein
VDEKEVARTTVAPTATEQLRVPLTRHGESCVVGFTVAPTAIPRDVTNGQNPDPRELGVHFSRFTYVP